MEAAVEVAAPAAVEVGRLMRSAEGFGSGGSGVVVVGEVRCHTEGACSSGGLKEPAFWRNIPDSEPCVEVCKPSSLHDNDATNDRVSGNTAFHPSTLDLDAKLVLQKSGKIVRNSSGCTKRSGLSQMEVSKPKPGLPNINGISPELASSSASCSLSEKNQLFKQKNSSTSRRGDKRNSKVKHKNRCDSFSLKNGLIGFNSATGGNNFYGIHGIKPDSSDITKYVNELSLDELLHGSYSSPSIAEDKGEKAPKSNNIILESVRKACSVLQAQKVLQAQNCAEVDTICTQKGSTSLVTVNSALGQTDDDKGDNCAADLALSDKCVDCSSILKVQDSDVKIQISNVDSPLYQPKDVFERLALPPPKDLDLLLSDASKPTSSKSTDPRVGKPVSQRTGLPPFPWSHSFSGHNKVGSDASKLSTSRTICQGRWVKVKNSTLLQKGSANLLADFETLTFDQSLVPSTNLLSEDRENEVAPAERVLSASGACSTSSVPADYSETCAAAKTLLDMAAQSLKQNPCPTVKLLKKPCQMAMKASKLKSVERSDKLFDEPKSTVRSTIPLKVGNDGSPSKKLRLSTDVKQTYIVHAEPVKKGPLHWPVKSPPRKLFRDSNAGTNNYGINLVKKSCMMKPPRGTDRPSSSQQKFRKPSQ
ncbi:uncharacterized protein LOC105158310 isoform X3 [Sesamum indicum]|uniref:Uncharacterized protein LOC105158310 isoform X3 n=1 Tax=Sesamum indicum TaxID=4182 RepID=A0A6I9SSA5_SESIN|nr:uncharacterized protein LOC105158310 isoform X3 [Sesamum indicum]